MILRQYDNVFNFVKKIFVGQIGQIKYVSNKQAYTFDEKYFDRFVEIVKNFTNGDVNVYINLIIPIDANEE